MIQLKELDQDNVRDVIRMYDTLTDEQKKCVAPNAVSIAQAYVHPTAWPRVIYDGDKMIGFVMLNLHDEDIPTEDQPAYYLWRFMIHREEQNKGHGKKVLDLITEKARAEKAKFLYTSCDMDGPMPYQFYLSYGFMDTGVNDGEQILKFDLR